VRIKNLINMRLRVFDQVFMQCVALCAGQEIESGWVVHKNYSCLREYPRPSITALVPSHGDVATRLHEAILEFYVVFRRIGQEFQLKIA
jgi:hypothetical protein